MCEAMSGQLFHVRSEKQRVANYLMICGNMVLKIFLNAWSERVVFYLLIICNILLLNKQQ